MTHLNISGMKDTNFVLATIRLILRETSSYQNEFFVGGGASDFFEGHHHFLNETVIFQTPIYFQTSMIVARKMTSSTTFDKNRFLRSYKII